MVAGVGLVQGNDGDIGQGVAAQLLLGLFGAGALVYRRDNKDAFLLLLQKARHVVGGIGDDHALELGRRVNSNALAGRQRGDLVVNHKLARLGHRLAVGVQQALGGGVVVFGFFHKLRHRLIGVHAGGQRLHLAPGIFQQPPAGGVQGLGIVIHHVVFAQHLVEQCFANRKIALCLGQHLFLQPGGIFLQRSRGRLGGSVHLGLQIGRSLGQHGHKASDQPHPLLGRFQGHLGPYLGHFNRHDQRLALGQHARRGAQAAQDALHALGQGSKIAQHQDVNAAQALIHRPARVALKGAQLIEIAQEALDHLDGQGAVNLGIQRPAAVIVGGELIQPGAVAAALVIQGGLGVITHLIIVAVIAQEGG